MSESLDGIGEVKEDSKTGLIDTEAGVASLLGGTGCNITWHEVSECRIAALEVVVPVLFSYL